MQSSTLGGCTSNIIDRDLLFEEGTFIRDVDVVWGEEGTGIFMGMIY